MPYTGQTQMTQERALARKDPIPQQDLIQIVASLAVKYGKDFKQRVIADRLEVSQSTISRALNLAEEQELLVRTSKFNGKLSPSALAVLARLENNESKITRSLRELEEDQDDIAFQEIDVFEVFDDQNDDKSSPKTAESPEQAGRRRERHIKQFGAGAGAILTRWLAGADRVGVTWGATIHFASMHIDFGGPSDKNPEFLPTCANIRTGRGQFTSTTIAGNLNHRATGNPEDANRYSLALNAFIPWEYSDEVVPEGRSESELTKFAKIMLESSKAYGDILGGYLHRDASDPASRFGTLITGIGEDHNPYGRNFNDFMRIARPRKPPTDPKARKPIDKEEIRRLFIGDFAGDLLIAPNPDFTADEIERANEIRRLWTGIRIEDMREIARAAALDRHDRTRMGVIVVGAGAGKAQTLLQAIRKGLVSRAVVDRQLMNALSDLAGHKSR